MIVQILPFSLQLNYTIRIKTIDLPFASDLQNGGTDCRYTDDDDTPNLGGLKFCKPTNYLYTGFVGLQALIDYNWIKVNEDTFEFPENITFQLPPREFQLGGKKY